MTTTTSTTSSTTPSTTTTASTSSTSNTKSSNASVGQSILSTLNASGTGIDTDTLITELTAAQQSSVETPITTKQTANAAQISSLATVTSDLTTFNSSLNSLVSGGALQTQPATSDSSVVAVSAIAGTPIGSLSDSVNVSQLAQAQVLESAAVTATSYSAADGSLGITVGGKTLTLNAGTDFTDLASLTGAINAKTASSGITASIATDAAGSHLVLKGQTGAAQAFTVAVTPATGSTTSALTGFAYDPSNVVTGGTQQVQTAQDATFTIDGVAYTRATNSVSDAIPGVSMTLSKTGSVSLYATRPTTAISSAVSNFVQAYNLMLGDITTATAAATSTSDAGPLQGNSTLRSLKTQLARLTTTPLNASGAVRTLAEIGVSTAQDGTLSVDTTKLTAALAAHPDDVEAMFTTSQSSSSSKVSVSSVAGTVASGVYSLTGLIGGASATGLINGVAMTASGSKLTAPTNGAAAGLSVQISSGAPSSATITINQGLGGALQAIHDSLLASNGALTALQTSLTTQKQSLADALTKADAQVTVYHDQLVKQFTTMTTLVSGYKATQSYLTQQVDLWTNKNNGN